MWNAINGSMGTGEYRVYDGLGGQASLVQKFWWGTSVRIDCSAKACLLLSETLQVVRYEINEGCVKKSSSTLVEANLGQVGRYKAIWPQMNILEVLHGCT